MAAAEPTLADRTAALDADWLVSRRWYRTKTRRPAAVRAEEAAQLGGTCWLVILAAVHSDRTADRYLVPAVAGPDGALHEPRDGDGAWREMVGAMVAGRAVQGTGGRFTFEATPALARLLPGGEKALSTLDESALGVEQSNTSVRIGERLILKVYRRLEPGTNPELEMTAFLTSAGFRWAPALAGAGTWRPHHGEASSAAMLQELVPSRGDAWAWLLGQLGDGPDAAREALAGIAQIGGITAELHSALASRPEEPGFPARPATAADAAAWHAAAERQLAGITGALAGRERARLVAISDRLRARLAPLAGAEGTVLTRIHGDYHLGQLLRTADGFAVVDFEGEPARPLAERRQPASPLRDVAGMLRSLDYAARSARRAAGDGSGLEGWLTDARDAFLTAYGGAATREAALLTALEVEKACYEVRYEADNRPDWTWLPIAALERLAE
jgi:trehalose synthase-fused probable maltokinase